MEFRLTFAGELLASNMGRDEKTARKEYKHTLRRRFHIQLKRLFEITPFLRTGQPSGRNMGGPVIGGHGPFRSATDFSYADVRLPAYDKEAVASKHEMYGFRFLPLVTKPLKLACSLDILFLRRQEPGSLWHGGDIDNRLKTLFDALTIPDGNQGYEARTPLSDEEPFYCLLEDDKLISKVSVETDRLLEDLPDTPPNENDARLFITVRIQPYEFTLENIMFT